MYKITLFLLLKSNLTLISDSLSQDKSNFPFNPLSILGLTGRLPYLSKTKLKIRLLIHKPHQRTTEISISNHQNKVTFA